MNTEFKYDVKIFFSWIQVAREDFDEPSIKLKNLKVHDRKQVIKMAKENKDKKAMVSGVSYSAEAQQDQTWALILSQQQPWQKVLVAFMLHTFG